MKIIILTGTIGSGKSTVAAILRELGGAVIDSDDVARRAIENGTEAYSEVIQAFGRDILDAAQNIDRRKLAAMVFQDPAALKTLNAIIHPRVDAGVETLLEQYQSEGRPAVFVEMAFLIETLWMERVDAVWVVKASPENALRRLEKRGVSRSDALARLANQPAPEKQVKKDLAIITNDGNPEDLRRQVIKLWQKVVYNNN